MACNCPKPTSLTAITATSCPEDLGQLQRVFLVRKGYVRWDHVTPANNFPGVNTGNVITVVAGWNILTALATDSKVIKLPLFGGDPTIASGESNDFGGNDNSTINGATYHINFSPSTFSARFDQLTAAQTLQLKALVCEDLEVYFVNDAGEIIVQDVSPLYTGFPVTNVSLKSRDVNGFGTRDSNIISFQMSADWDTLFKKVVPTDFNALTF